MSVKFATIDDVARVASTPPGRQPQPGTIILDVRTREEVGKTGRIPGAVHIPIADLVLTFVDPRVKRVEGAATWPPPKESEILVHCLMGARAKRATAALLALGYRNASCFEGGWQEWEKSSHHHRKSKL